ncbi:MAG: PilZ domain [Acidobacteriota bacterium]|jgi:hypothetical protein|nr:PilZ domain [Acidobacteriota bacterium]
MPELVRNLVGRLRAVVANRRRAPRKLLRLPCSISIHNPRLTDSARRAPSLEAHTRDLSTTGMALVTPTIRIGERYLNESTLHLRLEHPAGRMEILVAAVRYEQLPPEGEETGYLIGVRIVEMSDEDRAHFEAHLRQLT